LLPAYRICQHRATRPVPPRTGTQATTVKPGTAYPVANGSPSRRAPAPLFFLPQGKRLADATPYRLNDLIGTGGDEVEGCHGRGVDQDAGILAAASCRLTSAVRESDALRYGKARCLHSRGSRIATACGSWTKSRGSAWWSTQWGLGRLLVHGISSRDEQDCARHLRVREERARAALMYGGAACIGWCQFGPTGDLPGIKAGAPTTRGHCAARLADPVSLRRPPVSRARRGCRRAGGSPGGDSQPCRRDVEAYPEE
jgi:hypothetical protein